LQKEAISVLRADLKQQRSILEILAASRSGAVAPAFTPDSVFKPRSSFESVFQSTSTVAQQRTEPRQPPEQRTSAEIQTRQRFETANRGEIRQRTTDFQDAEAHSQAKVTTQPSQPTNEGVDAATDGGQPETTRQDAPVSQDHVPVDDPHANQAEDAVAITLPIPLPEAPYAAFVSGQDLVALDASATAAQQVPEHVQQNLAYLFGVDASVIAAALEHLGLSQQDLADPSNHKLLIMAVLGLEHEGQLLNVPDVAQIHRQLAQMQEQAPQPEVMLPETHTGQAVPPEASTTLPQPNTQTLTHQSPGEDQTETPLQSKETEAPTQATVADTNTEPGQDGDTHREGQFAPTGQNESRLELVQQSDGTVVVTETSSGQAARVVAVSSRPAPVGVNPQDIVRQLADNMRFDLRGANVSEIKLTLRPENLGEVTMKVAAENGIITASFVAENARVKEAIEANLQQLRQALEEKGIEVSQLSVSVDTGTDERMRQFLAEQARSALRLREISGTAVEDEAAQELAQRLPQLGSTVEFSA
jgi:flagellar hook-length control protein FliK